MSILTKSRCLIKCAMEYVELYIYIIFYGQYLIEQFIYRCI